MIYCPKCNAMVEARWKYGRERCLECNTGLDEHPIKFETYIPLGNAEISRRNVMKLVEDGTLSKEDLK